MADAQDGRVDEMEKSLGALQTEMREQIARTRVNTRVVLIVGLVVVVIIIGYLMWLTSKIKEAADPKLVAEDVMRYASEKAPAVEEQLKQSLMKSAPANVKAMEDMLLQQLPDLRQKAVAMGTKYLQDNSQKLRDMAIEEGKKYLAENSEKIRVQLAQVARKYVVSVVAQLPELREKAVAAMHRAIDQIPELRQKAEEAALLAINRVGDDLDQRADAIVDELLAKNVAELTPLIQAAGSPDGDKQLTEAFSKSLEEIVGTKMDEVLKEFDATLTPYEATLDRLQQPNEQLTQEERLHKEMITCMLLILDDALALGQMSLATPAPEPVINP